MITKAGGGEYKVSVYGQSEMTTVGFHPGPWFSGEKKQGEVCFFRRVVGASLAKISWSWL